MQCYTVPDVKNKTIKIYIYPLEVFLSSVVRRLAAVAFVVNSVVTFIVDKFKNHIRKNDTQINIKSQVYLTLHK
jgi:hypothetical protein